MPGQTLWTLPGNQPMETLIEEAQKFLWKDQWRQDLDFMDHRVAQLRWLAIKRGFIERLSK